MGDFSQGEKAASSIGARGYRLRAGAVMSRARGLPGWGNQDGVKRRVFGPGCITECNRFGTLNSNFEGGRGRNIN